MGISIDLWGTQARGLIFSGVSPRMMVPLWKHRKLWSQSALDTIPEVQLEKEVAFNDWEFHLEHVQGHWEKILEPFGSHHGRQEASGNEFDSLRHG